MINLTGWWSIDGVDFWSGYSLAVQKGTADFLRMAPRKPSIEHDWPGQHGIDIDTSKIILQQNSGTLECLMVTETENDFWVKWNAFRTKLLQPGLRRFSVKAHGNKSYFVLYQEMSNYRQVRSLKGIPDNLVVHSFSVTLLQPNPQVETSGETFLVADDGAFIII